MRKPVSALIALSMAAVPMAAFAQQEVPAAAPAQAPATTPAPAQPEKKPEPDKPKPVVAVSGAVGGVVGSIAGAAGGPVGNVAGGWVGGKVGRGVGRLFHTLFGEKKKKAAEAPVQTAASGPPAQSVEAAAQPVAATVDTNLGPAGAPTPAQ